MSRGSSPFDPRKADSPLDRAQNGPIDSAQVCGQGRTCLRCGVGQAQTVFDSKILKSCSGRTYGPSGSQNLPLSLSTWYTSPQFDS